MPSSTSMAARGFMLWALVGASDGATAGLAYSGGGIPGVLQSMCSQDWLYGNVPGFADASHSVSTASGGTIGYLLYQSLGSEGLEFPVPFSFDLTKEALSQTNASAGRKYWATVAEWLSGLTDPFGADPTKLGLDADPQDGWWQSTLRTGLFRLAYGVGESEVGQALGLGHHIVNLAVLERKACPLELTGVNGWMAEPERLHMATLEHQQGAGSFEMHISGGMEVEPKAGKDWQALDAAAYSSFFFTIGLDLVTNPTIYAAERALELLNKGVLISAKSTGLLGTHVYLTDGGLADTTGMVAHLQRKVSRIFAVYDNNNCLKSVEEDARCETASIAYLFGHNTSTNGQNTMGGPLLSQVFESSLYETVIANLTGPEMLARLTNVEVMRNDYFEVEPYTVDEIMILSNARSEVFLAEFSDPAVRAAVDDLWPDRIGLTPDVFNANLMCQHQRWKLDQHADQIKAFFAGSTTSDVVV